MAEALMEKIKSLGRRIKLFVHRLQRLEDAKKKSWLISLTALAMILFFSIWIVYINNFGLPRIAPVPAPEKEMSGKASNPASESFWETFSRGWQQIADQTKKGTKEIRSLIQDQVEKTNEINFNNETTALPIATSTINATTTVNASTTIN